MMSRRLIAVMVLLAFFAHDQRRANGQQSEVKPAPQAEGEVKPSSGEASTKTAPARGKRVPAWAGDARWHQIVVSKFRNGEASNDPPGCLPWSAKGDPFRKCGIRLRWRPAGLAGEAAAVEEAGRQHVVCHVDLQPACQAKAGPLVFVAMVAVGSCSLARHWQTYSIAIRVSSQQAACDHTPRATRV
jgi:hypothetical protein